jgi:hypothetical protein
MLQTSQIDQTNQINLASGARFCSRKSRADRTHVTRPLSSRHFVHHLLDLPVKPAIPPDEELRAQT